MTFAGRQQATPGRGLALPYASSRFSAFLDRRRVAIHDVVRGAAPESRRLLLGPRGGDTVTYAVAVGYGVGGRRAVENEQLVLEQGAVPLRPELRRSLPSALEHVEVYAGLDGLVMTAVPGLRTPARPWTGTRTRELLAAMPRWLLAVWEDTAGEARQVDLGAAELSTVLPPNESTRRLEPVLDAVRRARLRLAEYELPGVLTHGCLCPRHVTVDGDAVGVDDWGLGGVAGDPLRDLGRFAVSVAGGRLPEVLAGHSAFAAEVRQCVTGVLAHTPVPARLWREVLVLAQLELAVESLEHADPNGMHLLGRSVRLCGALTRTR